MESTINIKFNDFYGKVFDSKKVNRLKSLIISAEFIDNDLPKI